MTLTVIDDGYYGYEIIAYKVKPSIAIVIQYIVQRIFIHTF